mgnify:FL=1
MNVRTLASAVTGVLALLAVSPDAWSQPDEIAQLKAELRALQQRIEAVERRQTQAQAANAQPAAPTVAAGSSTVEVSTAAAAPVGRSRTNAAGWTQRIQLKGDLRYRNERFDVEGAADRDRDRIRARAGFTARINDRWRTELVLATGRSDHRSANQSLGELGARKDFGLDLAYAQWSPDERFTLTLGKMRQQWIRPDESLFIDGDINPEGLAAAYTHSSGLFANAHQYWLTERSQLSDSTLTAVQAGWRGELGSGVRLTIGAGYYDYGAVRGRTLPAPDEFDPFGNSTFTAAPGGGGPCHPAVGVGERCLANDYDIAEVFGEVSFELGGRPLTVFAEYGRNRAADELDTAYGAGVTWGRVRDARSWEIGYVYQDIERDALFAQFVDSDFADGQTDSRGSVIRVGYGLDQNFAFSASYFLNELNVSGLGSGGARRDYRRLQLDLNFRF